MGVTSVEKDPEALTVTVTANLEATVERAWQLWADPCQFERWWGPLATRRMWSSTTFGLAGGSSSS